MKNPVKKSTIKKGTNRSGRNMNPKKPGTDPDQTPTREVEKVPVAKPVTKGKP